jgi:hypothetical protein
MQEENQPTNGLIGLFLWALRLKMEEVTLSRRSRRPGARLQAGLSGAAFGGRATGKIYPKKRRRKNEAAVNDKKKKKHAVSNCLELDGAVVERRLDGEDGQQRLGSTPEPLTCWRPECSGKTTGHNFKHRAVFLMASLGRAIQQEKSTSARSAQESAWLDSKSSDLGSGTPASPF